MRSVIIRPARPEDDGPIGELLVHAFLATYAEKMPEVVYDDARKDELRAVALKRARAAVLAATLDDEMIGTVALFKPGAPTSEAWLPRHADLRHLAVHPAFHGKGVAASIMDRAEAIARDEWKVDGICLHVRQGAHGVARFYQKRGFAREPAGDLRKPTVMLEAYRLSFEITGYAAPKPL